MLVRPVRSSPSMSISDEALFSNELLTTRPLSSTLHVPGPNRFYVNHIDISEKFYDMQQYVFNFVEANNLTLEYHVHQQQQQPSSSTSPIGSDIKLRLPDKYGGTRDISTIENFFSQIDKLKMLKGWNDYKTYNIATTVLDLILSLSSILLLQNNNRLHKDMILFFGDKIYQKVRKMATLRSLLKIELAREIAKASLTP
ncbi:unnamed protein product [Mucor hiemalis]